MKFWTTEHIFPHSWTKVTEASWRKYNVPLSEVLLPHVLATDVIDRSVSDNGVMSSTRLFTVESVIPSWIRPIIGASESCGYVYETSEVDPRQKKMVLRSKNITLNSYVSVEETCTYTQLDDNTTHFKQECQISANISYLASRAETAVMDSFKKGAEKGRDTVEKVCHFIDTEVAEVEKALESVLHLERAAKSNDDPATE